MPYQGVKKPPVPLRSHLAPLRNHFPEGTTYTHGICGRDHIYTLDETARFKSEDADGKELPHCVVTGKRYMFHRYDECGSHILFADEDYIKENYAPIPTK